MKKLSIILSVIAIILLIVGFIGFGLSGFLRVNGEETNPILFWLLFVFGMILLPVAGFLSKKEKKNRQDEPDIMEDIMDNHNQKFEDELKREREEFLNSNENITKR